MPPKGGKVDAKAKKVVEDKTFGMKNKNKSAKVNKYMQQLQAQASGGNRKDKAAEEARKQSEAKKKAEADKKAELAELFKPVQTAQKIPFGVDPKTILCQYFKVGQCQKGNKCKFSHDLGVERKDQKINIYSDNRDREEKEQDTMDNWDQDKLENVIAKKHAANKNAPTDIVCKYFLEAIESRKYGWFWICPNGGDTCKYRHALPPGYVLKKKETDDERRAREELERENQITIEDFLETERHKLGPNLTPINYESFMKWKQERKDKKEKEADEAAKKKAEAYKQMRAGAKTGMSFSGRELFDFNPEWATAGDDQDAGAMDKYVREESDQELDADMVTGSMKSLELGGGEERDDTQTSREDMSVDKLASREQMNVDESLFDDEDLEGLDDMDE